jgi:hypothetical protein
MGSAVVELAFLQVVFSCNVVPTGCSLFAKETDDELYLRKNGSVARRKPIFDHFSASVRYEAAMDDSAYRCSLCHLDWQLEELHLCRTQCSATSLQWILVPVLPVRCIAAVEPIVSGIELSRKRGPVRVVLQLLLLVQHDGQQELDVLLLSELTPCYSHKRFVIPAYRFV